MAATANRQETYRDRTACAESCSAWDRAREPRSPLQGVGLIAAAAFVALAIWGLARVLGIELTVGKDADAGLVGPVDVLVAATVAGLAAWGAQALLARCGAARWWPSVGSTALAVSVVGPSHLADGLAGVVVMCMHLAVGAVLIAGFAGVVPRSR
jgi:Family of unknown function (DUF6069)